MDIRQPNPTVTFTVSEIEEMIAHYAQDDIAGHRLGNLTGSELVEMKSMDRLRLTGTLTFELHPKEST